MTDVWLPDVICMNNEYLGDENVSGVIFYYSIRILNYISIKSCTTVILHARSCGKYKKLMQKGLEALKFIAIALKQKT